MYMTFPNPKNEKSRALIVFILCVLFLAVAFKVSGQACYSKYKPYGDHQEITRILSCDALTYEANGNEIRISIFADSINPTSYAVNIFAFFPKDKMFDSPKLVLNFEDNESQEIVPYFSDSSTGYIEFSLKTAQFIKIRDFKIDYIDFVNDGTHYSVFEQKIDLFYDFMRGL